MTRGRFRLPLTFAATVAAAFITGTLAAAAYAYLALVTPSELTNVNLRNATVAAAETLRRDLVERRREVELLAHSAPVGDAEGDSLRLFLRRAQEDSPFYAVIGFIDADGRVVATSNGVAEGTDVRSRDFFKFGRLGPYVSDAHPAFLMAKALGARDSTFRLIDVAAPVVVGGKTVGVLAAHLSTDWAQTIAAEVARQIDIGSGRLAIVDSSGAIIAHVEHSEIPPLKPQEISEPFLQRRLVSGVGDSGAAHWTVEATAPPSWSWLSVLAGAAIWLAGLALMSALGWAIGRKVADAVERHTHDIALLPSGRAPQYRAEAMPEFSDLGAAIHLAAEDFHREKID